MILLREVISGERVSNTWATCPSHWDNLGKPGLIPNVLVVVMITRKGSFGLRIGMGPRPIS